MSLLDDVSIVVTPNGYKAGTLYGVLPVPIEGSELINCGNFSCADPNAEWTRGTGWTISGGTANCDGSQTTTTNLHNAVSNGLINNVKYIVTYTISNYSAGSIRIKLGNSGFGADNSANGTYTETITALVTTFPTAQFNADSSFNGSVDNVSVKQFTASDMDVTRATAATRVDENGLVNYAEILGSELVTNGNFDSNITGWSAKSSTIVWDNGKLKVDNSSGNLYGGAYQNIGLVTGKQYKMTLTMQLLTGSSNGTFMLFTSSASGGSQSLVHTGGVLVVGGAAVTETFIFTPASGDVSIQPSVEEANATFTIDNVSVKEVTRNNVPRIDYTGGGCPHILAEPQRTNSLLQSNQFDTTWTLSNSSVVANQSGIYNTTDAWKLVANGSNNDKVLQNVASGTSTFSIYAKKGNKNFTVITLGSGFAYYNIETGVITSSGGVVSTNIQSIGNGWYRLSITVALTSASNVQIYVASADGSVLTNNGDFIYIQHSQLEVGSYATSIIPTSTSTVTRNADIFQRDGIASLIGQTEGTMFVDVKIKTITGNEGICNISSGAYANHVSINRVGNKFQFVRNSATQSGATIVDSSTITVGSFKLAIAYKSGDTACFLNGTQVSTTQTQTFTNGTLNVMRIGADPIGSIPVNANYNQVQVYKTALTDAQLISLTS